MCKANCVRTVGLLDHPVACDPGYMHDWFQPRWESEPVGDAFCIHCMIGANQKERPEKHTGEFVSVFGCPCKQCRSELERWRGLTHQIAKNSAESIAQAFWYMFMDGIQLLPNQDGVKG